MLWDLSERVLEVEEIDHLESSAPDAIRSRRDLRLIDIFLGNSRWIARRLKSSKVDSIVELGSGDGHLSRKLSGIYPKSRITGMDLAPPPMNWVNPLHWIQGDLLQTIRETRASICIGSLVLHHFDRVTLAELGKHLRGFSTLIFSEPHRHCQSMAGSCFFQPFVGKVVRHDMPASISAGFRKGEIADSLGLETTVWSIEEYVTIRGSIRFFATNNHVYQHM
jgi:hypothetical protein